MEYTGHQLTAMESIRYSRGAFFSWKHKWTISYGRHSSHTLEHNIHWDQRCLLWYTTVMLRRCLKQLKRKIAGKQGVFTLLATAVRLHASAACQFTSTAMYIGRDGRSVSLFSMAHSAAVTTPLPGLGQIERVHGWNRRGKARAWYQVEQRIFRGKHGVNMMLAYHTRIASPAGSLESPTSSKF